MNDAMGMIDLPARIGLNDNQQQMMITVHHFANALLTIISDILDFSMIEVGKLDLDSIPFSILEVIESVGETQMPTDQEGLEIVASINPAIPDPMMGDLEMFGINRFELVHKLRAAKNPNFSDLSILIVTSLSKPVGVTTTLEAKIHGFLVSLISRSALKNQTLTTFKGERIDCARTKR